MKILGIETSCDETAVCLIEADGDFGPSFKFKILGNALISQAATHSKYGGVFPNLAKREHAKNLVPLLTQVLNEAGARRIRSSTPSMFEIQEMLAREPELYEQLVDFLQQYAKPDIDAIAVTAGPGLEPALWVGVNFARALSLVWNTPIVAVNHMEGHIVMSAMENGRLASFAFPAIALLISGGHTELILMHAFGRYEILGETRDDAVGEAFDKIARMLELGYPGGPEISKLASAARVRNLHADFKLPRPMLREDNFDFSFSGLKTAVLRIVESGPVSEEKKLQIAREFEDAAADVLVEKTLRAVEKSGAATVIVGGGVSANTHIRLRLAGALAKAGAKLLVCPPEFSTDNALMIALSGYFHALSQDFMHPDMLRADGNMRLEKRP